MKTHTIVRFGIILAINVVGLCVLGFYRPTSAQTPQEQQPFANSVEQRAEIIAQLKDVVAELKEQNALLRSGNLKVVVTLDKKQ
jgi:type II secretory pathway component PulM